MKIHIILLIVLITFLLVTVNGEKLRVYNSPPLILQTIRRILHQPLYPDSSTPPPGGGDDISLSPPPPAPPADGGAGYTPDQPFFPEVPSGSSSNSNLSPPVAPTVNGSVPIPAATQPAKPTTKVAIAISVGMAALGMIAGFAFYVYRHRAKNALETQKLVGGAPTSRRYHATDDSTAPPPSNFLYIGTVEPSTQQSVAPVSDDNVANGSPYHKLNSAKRLERYRPSPDLQPLPPLSKAPTTYSVPERSSPTATISSSDEESRDTMFYTPHGSIASSLDESFWTPAVRSNSHRGNGNMVISTSSKGEYHGGNSHPHSKRSSPRSRLLASASPDVVKHAIIPSIKATPPPPPPPPEEELESNEYETQDKQVITPKLPRKAKFAASPPPPPNVELLHTLSSSPGHQKFKTPPPPPPPPPPRPMAAAARPPPPPPPPPRQPLSTPKKVCSNIPNGSLRPSQVSPKSQYLTPNSSTSPSKETVRLDETLDNGCSSFGRPNGDDFDERRPKLKPLHWDKVKATSDRATVWDQLKSSSFQLNEDMMESLFGCNSSDAVKKEVTRKPVLPPVEKENRVLDPKKSQNIAILLRALNVTRDEVAEALLDGNPEGLGAELLETLVKMAPTKEEEIKLKDYNGDISKLGTAERFLKGILDIPFAFTRVESMLYKANFDAEVKYLTKSFETLEIASEELKNSRLFLKLLEAVLQTGNRMNVGTNRGDAKAFKLDTLLKLVDIKGADGKTTLLHFVVQEIVRSEGIGSDVTTQTQKQLSSAKKEEEFRKQGLLIVSGLSKELGSVKSAAGMDFDVLSNYLTKLEKGLEKVRLVLQYEKPDMQGRFFESMKKFIKEAEEEIARVKAHERKALSRVREVTEYFHGDTAKEEAHPLRVFLIVRDFLSILDNVCKEVGRMEDRTVMGTARSFRISAYASLPVLTKYNVKRDDSSEDEGMSSYN